MKYIVHPTNEEEKILVAFLEEHNIIYYTEDLPDFMLHEKKDPDEVKAKNIATLHNLKKHLEDNEIE
ncbi:hypothetical protein HQ865_04605 [Mucilaginibacter mali]|uniref:Uncharacterized protein n=1 Tax=Mucilaginibacter mali TaxID=2740462 RepID=A0A7D4UKY3_9SPHI|nr:hypothetical protein [Mucilaginibacter mali]QKJ29061.1 hypothetical protein HQ865_04605 [Mucilaginibacter mali]